MEGQMLKLNLGASPSPSRGLRLWRPLGLAAMATLWAGLRLASVSACPAWRSRCCCWRGCQTPPRSLRMCDVNVSVLPRKIILGIFTIRTYPKKIVIAFMLWIPCLCGGLTWKHTVFAVNANMKKEVLLRSRLPLQFLSPLWAFYFCTWYILLWLSPY